MSLSEERAAYVQRDFFSDAIFVRGLFRSCVYHEIGHASALGELIGRLREGELDRLVISNPYRDGSVRELYDRARAEALPLLIVERGALPRTIFLDTSGFLRDSVLYERRHWDRPLDEAEASRLDRYKAELAGLQEALEPQAPRAGVQETRRRLLNGRSRLCAVTLQMSTDAVTNHFCRPGLDYSGFKRILAEAVGAPPGDWAFAVKPHPREPLAGIEGQSGLDGVNISDLLEAADALVTFNSGTGVAAMMRDKPVGCFGDAFYGGEGLTASLGSVGDLATFLGAPQQSFDGQTRARFLHHLAFRVYSEVRFLGAWPFGRMSRPVAMQGRVVRIYDPATMRTREVDRRRRRIGDIADREAERLRAWYRAALNRGAALSG